MLIVLKDRQTALYPLERDKSCSYFPDPRNPCCNPTFVNIFQPKSALQPKSLLCKDKSLAFTWEFVGAEGPSKDRSVMVFLRVGTEGV